MRGNALLGFGMGELVLIGFVALILFGDKNLPGHFRRLAKWVATARGLTTEAQKSWVDVKTQIARSLLNEDDSVSVETKPVQEDLQYNEKTCDSGASSLVVDKVKD